MVRKPLFQNHRFKTIATKNQGYKKPGLQITKATKNQGYKKPKLQKT
jgi:hypothetical protein